MSEAKYLACPFCGRQPQLSSRGSEHTKTGWLFIASCMCGGNSARAHMTGDSESDVRAKWNTRAGGQQSAASEPPGVSTSASANGSDAPKLSDDQIATRLCAMLTQEMMYKADCFDYLCWLNETEQRENVKTSPFLVLASDGTTCWGKSYADCVKVAMKHDKELYDAVQNLVLPDDEHQNAEVSEGGTRDSRIETAAQSRPSLH